MNRRGLARKKQGKALWRKLWHTHPNANDRVEGSVLCLVTLGSILLNGKIRDCCAPISLCLRQIFYLKSIETTTDQPG